MFVGEALALGQAVPVSGSAWVMAQLLVCALELHTACPEHTPELSSALWCVMPPAVPWVSDIQTPAPCLPSR